MYNIIKNLISISIVRRLAITNYVLMFLFTIPHHADAVPFKFVVIADMREYAGSGTYDQSKYFKGVCEAITNLGLNAFTICPGDLDPPDKVNWTIKQYLGDAYVWYPVAGNHEAETSSDMRWLRNYNEGGNSLPNIVNIGPKGCEETTYSFDYENAHFAVINEYYDGTSDRGTDGDVVDALYDWLAADLAATTKPHIFVIGHEPAYPQPDADNGRVRHLGDSLDKYPAHRDRFWNLLRERGVLAYICGHSHCYSSIKINGVWQLDVGHCRGAGDTEIPSTLLTIDVVGDNINDVIFKAYRDDHEGVYDYDDIVHSWNASLPVKLSTFTIHQEDKVVVLEWMTESETLNLGYILERRQKETDNWNEIASYLTHQELAGQGSISYRSKYQYIDRTVQAGFAYQYRLADVSYDGTVEYHRTVQIKVKASDDIHIPETVVLRSAYPNPFNQETIIEYMPREETEINLSVVNLIGRTVKQLVKDQKHSAGSYSVRWNATNDFDEKVPSGVYFAVLRSGTMIKSQKLIFLR